MPNQDKDIVISPNRGSSTADPNIRFTGGNANVAASVNVSMYADGTLSFEGTAGQLFSITNSLTGTIFSVNDVSGIPSIEVTDAGIIRLAQYNGNVGIGTATPSTTLHVQGNIIASDKVGIGTASTTGIIGSNVLTVFGNVNIVSPNGAYLVNGVATTGGTSSGGSPTMVVVSGTTQSATKDNRYVITNASTTTITLPSSPAAGDILYIVVANNLSNNVVARNGSKIMSLNEDLTLDINNMSIGLLYVNSTLGWIIV